MKALRGDVILLDYPYFDGSGAKVRPALIVQADARNSIMTHTIVAMITKNTSRIGQDSTQVLIDITTPDGKLSGLIVTSAVTCGNLFTIHEKLIRKKIGQLSSSLMNQVASSLKVALELP